VAQAIAESGRENCKTKLPMTNSERQDYAWRLTKMGLHSRAEVAKAAGVGPSQVAIMRGVLTKLGPERSAALAVWIDAKRISGKMDGEGREVDATYLEALAQSYADRLHKEFGSQFTGNIEMCARALEIHLGPDRAGELVAILQEGLPDDEETDEVLGQPF